MLGLDRAYDRSIQLADRWGDLVHHRPMTPTSRDAVTSLRSQVGDEQLWACHLTPDLGGQGFDQPYLALMNEAL